MIGVAESVEVLGQIGLFAAHGLEELEEQPQRRSEDPEVAAPAGGPLVLFEALETGPERLDGVDMLSGFGETRGDLFLGEIVDVF